MKGSKTKVALLATVITLAAVVVLVVGAVGVYALGTSLGNDSGAEGYDQNWISAYDEEGNLIEGTPDEDYLDEDYLDEDYYYPDGENNFDEYYDSDGECADDLEDLFAFYKIENGEMLFSTNWGNTWSTDLPIGYDYLLNADSFCTTLE